MTIRNVSDEDRDRVAAKAARAGKSLQEYLLALVSEHAQREDPWEVLDNHRARLHRSGGGSLLTADEIVRLVHEGRDAR